MKNEKVVGVGEKWARWWFWDELVL